MDQELQEPQSTPKQQVAESIRQATNLLVTVRSNPSVDELSAVIGLTLMLNKLGKHAIAVFSGQVPSTLEFLKPEETLEVNTDSLRDFIISLDKSKADKLRYKVEENVVKIFITPYRTSISEKDLEFTQGEINVDVVLALGVSKQEDLDEAITAHGRILHDATVITVTQGEEQSTLGNINWQEPTASGLCEMLVSISEALQGGLIDAQIATAFLTGIVAETERFSNTKTSPKVMTMSAQLMAAGANQQLIANELQKTVDVSVQGAAPMPELTPEVDPSAPAGPADDGALAIDHPEDKPAEEASAPAPESAPEVLPEPAKDEPKVDLEPPSVAGRSILPSIDEQPEPEAEVTTEQIAIDDEGNFVKRQRPMNPKHNKVIAPPKQIDDARDKKKIVSAAVDSPVAVAPIVVPEDTIAALEQSIQQANAANAEPTHVDSARDSVNNAINQAGFDPNRPEPRVDLNAQPFVPEAPEVVAPEQMQPAAPAIDTSLTLPSVPQVMPSPSANNSAPQAPPPLPPPLPM